jgi:hypothetical protein
MATTERTPLIQMMIDHVKAQSDYHEDVPKHWLQPTHGMERALLAYIEGLEKRPLPKKTATPKKKLKKRPCEDCGSKKATFGPCPFKEDMYNDKTPEWICEGCRANRAMEL